ncbi:MAG: hypothetical protein WC992_05130 [Acholeplasmataceae bacterium]|jgi:hypothetical protein
MDDGTGQAIDLVVPLGSGSTHGDLELRYLLRSAEKHFAALGKVWIVGECPEWLDTAQARHIAMPDAHADNKDANLIEKILRVCAEPELSGEFVRASDDQVFWAPVVAGDLLPVRGERLAAHTWKWFLQDRWHKRMLNTVRALAGAGIADARNFDTHMPVLYSKTLFARVMETFAPEWRVPPGCCVNTLYFNEAQQDRFNARGYGELKVSFEDSVLCMLPHEVRQQIKAAGPDVRFLGYNETGFSDGLREVLERAFPNPSKYERHGR